MCTIFLSYRQADLPYIIGRIYDKLVETFEKNDVFRDVNSIAFGENIAARIDENLSSCDVLLPVIGDQWLDIEEGGIRRLENADDPVRVEIESALTRSDLRIIPVLVEGREMRDLTRNIQQIPEGMRALTGRKAAKVRPDPDFHDDMDALIAAIQRYCDAKEIKPTRRLDARDIALADTAAPDAAVHGFDERTLVDDTTRYPYSAVCQLAIETRDGRQFSGTGVLVAPRLVLTVGGGVYERTGGFVESVKVVPGRNAELCPFGEFQSGDFRSTTHWMRSQDPAHEIGAILLSESVGDQTGHLGLACVGDEALENASVSVVGYPTDKSPGTQWTGQGQVSRVNQYGFAHSVDTGPGMAGAPVVVHDARSNFTVIGLHGYRDRNLRAIRLTEETLQLVQRWMAESEGI